MSGGVHKISRVLSHVEIDERMHVNAEIEWSVSSSPFGRAFAFASFAFADEWELSRKCLGVD